MDHPRRGGTSHRAGIVDGMGEARVGVGRKILS
jgi:hypothetical protein